MKKLFRCFFVSIACVALITNCSTDLYDYNELNERLDVFDKRLADLEEWCKETNTNINSLKVLVESLLENDMVKSVTPVLNGNEVIGYTVTFLKADPITIYHGEKGADGEDGQDGKDGKDGYTPMIGVKQDTDGLYYWTLDGEWLKDAQGNKVKAQGENGADGSDGADGADGQDGKDGVAPQLKIENNYWHISYDNGQTWIQLEKAIGEDGKDGQDGKDGKDGDSFFQSVDCTTSSDYVVFTFSDGSELKLPTWSAFDTYRNQVNTTITSLQTLVTALQQNDYITGYDPVLENGQAVGYTIKFAKANPITIYHGKEGTDGESPMVGVKKDTDDVYYWTLNGEWLKDEQGNKVKAQGKDGSNGANGTDGKTPQIKIGDDGYWYVSYDGINWIQLSDKPASAGNDVFQEIKVEPGKLIFILKDGTELSVPTFQKVEIAFTMDYEKSGIAANEVIYVPYTLTHATANTLITASSDGNYAVMVEPKDQHSGQIVITAPNKYVDGFVNVHIDNGNGFSSVHVINFYHQQMHFSKGQEYVVAAEGQTLTVPVSTNFNYTVDIPSSAQSWVSVANSRAVNFRDETLTFTFPANPNKSSRSASIGIVPNNAKEALYYITFNQASKFFTIDKTRFAVKGEGETLTVNITSSLGLKLEGDADWITKELAQDGTKYTLTLKVAANDTESYRTHVIKLYENNGTSHDLLGEINLIQLSQTNEDQKNLVIKVSANPANNYTVTLPIDNSSWNSNYGKNDTDCVIDWGDGTMDHITSETLPTHTYTGLSGATHYHVKITGTVRSLCSQRMSAIQRNGIIGVEQWGVTGLKCMEYAFNGCANLKSVPADNTGAFVEIKNFSYCFAGCSSLVSVSDKLFTHAIEATDFSYVFSGCAALTEIPVDLFKNCVKVTTFSGTFQGCTSITTIPETLFASNSEVTAFSYTFSSCSSLQSIPEKLFVNNLKVKDFMATFNYTAITTIPEKLFEKCTEVLYFGGSHYNHGAFSHCSQLTNIPAGLFVNNTKVISFGGLFAYNSSLITIPEGLFDACTMVERFVECFYFCQKLKNIPVSIFDKNRKVTDFEEVFYNCEKLEGESPYTMIGGVKVHLYERHLYGEEFVKPMNGTYAFWYCNKLTDYTNIPSDWK